MPAFMTTCYASQAPYVPNLLEGTIEGLDSPVAASLAWRLLRLVGTSSPNLKAVTGRMFTSCEKSKVHPSEAAAAFKHHFAHEIRTFDYVCSIKNR